MIAAVVCILLASPAVAEDRYWTNYFSGTWVDPLMINWQTSTGVPGLPGPGDRALVVLPYPMGMPQPVYVGVVSPGASPIEVNTIIIESGNYLNQWNNIWAYPRTFPAGYNLNLTSNIEIVGGSGQSFTAPPGYFGGNPSPPPITPKGAHYQSAGTNTVNTELILGNIASSEGTYELTGGSLSVGSFENIGKSGKGTFTQSGGSHTVGSPFNQGSLILGNSSTGTGTYTLNGGQLTVMGPGGGREIVGSAGTGTFTQSGGTNATDSLVLGQVASGNGTYNLKQGGTLHVTEEIIGSAGTGTFKQDWLSENTTYSLVLAKEAGSFGTYEMDGDLTVASKAEIGRLGRALFTQQYGSLTVNEGGSADGGMWIGGHPATIFRLDDGLLKVYGTETIDKGSFQQFNSQHYVFGTATAAGDLIIDSDTTGYVLVNGGLSTNNNLVVGNTKKGRFVQGDGIVTVSGGLYVGQSAGSFGTVEQSGGTLTAPVAQVGGLGAGRLTLSGGDHTVQYTLVVGGNMNPDATITTGAGGVVKMTDGSLTVGNEILRNTNYAFDDAAYKSAFDQSGGTHIVNQKLKIDFGANYELSGGSLSAATEEIWGDFHHTGGTHTVTGELTNSGHYYLGDGQQVSAGTFYNNAYIGFGEGSNIKSVGGLIQNGSPDNTSAVMSSETGSGGLYGNATIKNYAKIEVTGGNSPLKAFEVIGNLENYPDAEIRIGEASQALLTGFLLTGNLSNYSDWRWTDPPLSIGYWQRGQIVLNLAAVAVTGDIDNEGDIRVDSGSLMWTGTLRVGIGGHLHALWTELAGGDLWLNGGFWTDPTTVRVGTMVVGETGHITAMVGDRFFIGGDFINRSIQNTLWDTDLASLIFENAMSRSHEFYLAGLDLGAIANGFLDNFAWGSLSLAAGEELHLFDGNLDTPGAALYVGLITPMNFDFIFSEFNIYYNAMLSGNEWLGGEKYHLHGTGWLIPFIGGIEPPGPEPVPEPATMILLGSGLIGLAAYGRKKFFKK